MTDATIEHAEDTHDDGAHDDHGHDDHGAHPTEKQYWVVFVVLAILTAVEVAWSYLGLEGAALVVPLILMMVVKFLLVAGIFMHLYFDTKMLHGRLFWWTFAAATTLALLVYFIVFASFDQVF